MKTKGKHLHLEPLRMLVPLCYGNKAHASNQAGSLASVSLQRCLMRMCWGNERPQINHGRHSVFSFTLEINNYANHICLTVRDLIQIESKQISTRHREEEDEVFFSLPPLVCLLFFLLYHLSLKTAAEMLMSDGRQQSSYATWSMVMREQNMKPPPTHPWVHGNGSHFQISSNNLTKTHLS